METPALLSFWVDGIPATQGSKTPNRGGFGFHEADKKLPAWREAVTAAAKEMAKVFDGPLDFPMRAHLDVYLPAPAKSKFGRWPAGKPDLDKLQRAVGDGLSDSKLIRDDARIVSWRAAKHWAEEGTNPGARISLEDVRDELYTPLDVVDFYGDAALGDDGSWAAVEETGTLTEAMVPDLSFEPFLPRFRGHVMLDGQLRTVEMVATPELAEVMSGRALGGFSIAEDPDPIRAAAAAWRARQVELEEAEPMALTPEAYAQMKAEKEIERRYGKGGL